MKKNRGEDFGVIRLKEKSGERVNVFKMIFFFFFEKPLEEPISRIMSQAQWMSATCQKSYAIKYDDSKPKKEAKLQEYL